MAAALYRPLNTLKYLTNWYEGAVKKNPLMVDDYEKQSEEYVEKNVKGRKPGADIKVLGNLRTVLSIHQAAYPQYPAERGQAFPVSDRSANRGAGAACRKKDIFSMEKKMMQSLLTWCRILTLKQGICKRKIKKPEILVASGIF